MGAAIRVCTSIGNLANKPRNVDSAMPGELRFGMVVVVVALLNDAGELIVDPLMAAIIIADAGVAAEEDATGLVGR